MLTAVAIDPGVTTGFCTGTLLDRNLDLVIDQEKLTCHEMYERLNALMSLDAGSMHIIYEDFSYRNVARTGLNLMPVKLIGIIELFQERYEPLVTFTKQSAAQGKAYYSDEKLKRLGVYVPGKEHGRDALRHLLQWYTFGPGSQYGNVDQTRLKVIFEHTA